MAKAIRAAWNQMGKQPAAAAPAAATPPAPDWKALSDAVGLPGALQEDGTFKIALPRPQLGTSIDGQLLTAGVGLGCWVGFAPASAGERWSWATPACSGASCSRPSMPTASTAFASSRSTTTCSEHESRADLLPLLGGRGRD